MRYTRISADEITIDLLLGVHIYAGRTPLEASLNIPWRLLNISITPTSWSLSWNVYWDNSKWLRVGPLWIVWL